MNAPPDNAAASWRAAEALDCVLIGGRDAAGFLQAQLTCDVSLLIHAAVLPFAWCSPAGRVRYAGWLTRQPEGFCMLLAAGTGPDCMAGLSRFILRAKVRLQSASDAGLSLCWKPAGGLSAAEITETARAGQIAEFQLPGIPQRLVRIARRAAPAGDDNAFLLAGIRAGVCELPGLLSERFLPQMLNLDLTGGISFEKGCYPGQEVVARTHHLGRVKRRLMRFTSVPDAAAPGVDILSGDAVTGTTVAAATSAEISELLAVVQLEASHRALVADTPARPRLIRAALPYDLPGD